MNNDVQKTIDYVEKHCIDSGVRFTEKRKSVLSGLLKSKKALSAYEIADYCKADLGTAIPTMSVYRILNFFEDRLFVHKLNLANKYIACSHITCNHHHGMPQFLICKQCQQVKEINIDKNTIQSIHKTVGDAGFHMMTPQLEINCLCETCFKTLN